MLPPWVSIWLCFYGLTHQVCHGSFVHGEPRVSYVIEPFESLDFIKEKTRTQGISHDYYYSGAGAIAVNITSPLVEVEALASGEAAHNCRGASQISVWYKFLEPSSLRPENTTMSAFLSLDLVSGDDGISFWKADSDTLCEGSGACINNGLKNYAYRTNQHQLIPANGDWAELVWTLDEEDSGIDAPGAKALDLTRVDNWKLSVVSTNSSNSMVFFDQLACYGGPDMIGSVFWTQRDAFGETYYFSEQAREGTNLTLHNGLLELNPYVVQKVEAWGGFSDFAYLAPAMAYYNLSGMSGLSLFYNNKLPPKSTGRVHLRLKIGEASDCILQTSPGPCTDLDQIEQFYSFHYVLDSANNDTATIPFGDVPGSFRYTGWVGIAADKVLDSSYVKSIAIEISIGGDGEMNSTLSGSLAVGRLRALTGDSLPFLGEEVCTEEENLHVTDWSQAVSVQFSSNCCEDCAAREDCKFFYACDQSGSVPSTCVIFNDTQTAQLVLDNSIERSGNKFTWFAGSSRDFCGVCDCSEVDRTIDCRGRDLQMLPNSFQMSWKPEVLDLRKNPRIAIIGSQALASVSASLMSIRLPSNLSFVSLEAVKSIPSIDFEHDESRNIHQGPTLNIINNRLESFGHQCCSKGETVPSINGNLTFCQMPPESVGEDVTYFPFTEWADARVVKRIVASSPLFAEACQSPAKCAEYCKLSPECRFFTYDGRVSSAEPTCYLLRDNGTSPETHCCRPDHYGDEAQSKPGYVSGWPPAVRRELENARVIITPLKLEANLDNNFTVEYDVHLGSNPYRGAVWVHPKIVAPLDSGIIADAYRVALYDNTTRASISVSIPSGLRTSPSSSSVYIISHEITSCDAAFGLVSESEVTVFVSVVRSSNREAELRTAIVIFFSGALFLAFGLTFLIFRRTRRFDNSWKLTTKDILFPSTPRTLGQGSFGMVLLGEVQGVQVAVKRVLPPAKEQKMGVRCRNAQLLQSDDFSVSEDVERPLRRSKNDEMSAKRRAKILAEFVDEMRILSKLRHSCIVTLVGAILAPEEAMLVMEVLWFGSLYDILRNESMPLDGDILLPIICDIVQGMRFLHNVRPEIVHGDLRTHNILLDDRFRAKVGNFGFSYKGKVVGEPEFPFWKAPELLRGESSISKFADVYSFGIILFELYSRKEPFEQEHPIDQVIASVVDRKEQKRPSMPEGSPQAIEALMRECVVDGPAFRPSFEEIDIRVKRLNTRSVDPGDTPSAVRYREATKSADLLSKMFPRHIVEALKEGRELQPDRGDSVAVLFSDIVGFTALSASLTAEQVTDMLDRFYSKLDAVVEEKGIFKVDTIGDAYMCATNLVEDQDENHVRLIAEFAIALVEIASTTMIVDGDPSYGFLCVRCGFHVGPAEGRVVGRANPKYSIFGDTVNTAARMESTSEPGFIQCSERAARLLQRQSPDALLCSRGEISVKGKSPMPTYFVNVDGDPPPPDDQPPPEAVFASSFSALVCDDIGQSILPRRKLLQKPVSSSKSLGRPFKSKRSIMKTKQFISVRKLSDSYQLDE